MACETIPLLVDSTCKCALNIMFLSKDTLYACYPIMNTHTMSTLHVGAAAEESEPSQHSSVHWHPSEGGEEPCTHHRVCRWWNPQKDNQECGMLFMYMYITTCMYLE